jgi:beta-glucosidase
MTAARPWMDASRSPPERAKMLLAAMTLPEKIAQLAGVWGQACETGGLFDAQKAERVLQNGTGHVTRAAQLKSPTDQAHTNNMIQRALVDHTRLGVPAVFHEESCAGYMAQDADMFPMPIGLAATFNPDLVRQMGGVIRRQMVAVGARHTLAPVADVARDARWGRCEETFGEDPYLVGRMAVAYVQGVQGEDLRDGVVCTGKHFMGYSASQGGLNWAPAPMGRREMMDVFAAPFAAMIAEAGVASIMNGYQEIDGVVCGASKTLLTDVLRGELGFSGTVSSDYFTVPTLANYHNMAASPAEAARIALEAGLDIELPAIDGYKHLEAEIAAGRLKENVVDNSVLRVLEQKFALGLFEYPYADEGKTAAAYGRAEDRELSLSAAEQSMVLLKNDGVLPLSKEIKRIALIGPAADSARLLQGDYHYPAHHEILYGAMPEQAGGVGGANAGTDSLAPMMSEAVSDSLNIKQLKKADLTKHLPPTATILAGLQAAMPHADIACHAIGMTRDDDTIELSEDEFEGMQEEFETAIVAMERADAIVMCVGTKSGLVKGCTSGEATDSATLEVSLSQSELLANACHSGKPVVVVVVSGRPLVLPPEIDDAGAILHAWVPGPQGGVAIANILAGKTNPSGKLPMSMPRHAGQMPLFYNHKPSGMRSQFWGDYADTKAGPIFPFGHGLSYSEFEYGAMQCDGHMRTDGRLHVSITLANVGKRAGTEIVQLYVRDHAGSVTRPVKELKGFARVHLGPGEKRHVSFVLDASALAFTGLDYKFSVEPGPIDVMIGASSADIKAKQTVDVEGPRRILKYTDVAAAKVDIA